MDAAPHVPSCAIRCAKDSPSPARSPRRAFPTAGARPGRRDKPCAPAAAKSPGKSIAPPPSRAVTRAGSPPASFPPASSWFAEWCGPAFPPQARLRLWSPHPPFSGPLPPAPGDDAGPRAGSASRRYQTAPMRRIVPTFYYNCVRQVFRIATMALLGLIFITNVYRAATQSITHDEAVTYENFVAAPWSIVFNSYDANHHVLHTMVCKIFVDLLGVSPLTLRLASVLSGLLYLYLIFRICERLFGTGWYLPLSALLLSLNPYLLDFESAARGYGMAVAFLFLALWEMLEWLDKPESGRLVGAGVALGLSIGANLVLAPPAIGLALMFLFAVWNQRRTFKPTITVTKKGTKKETPNPFPTLGQALVRFALPLVGIAAVIILSPLSNSSGQQFYIGAASLRAGAESIVRNSLQPAPGWLISTLALAVLPALLVVGALIAWRAASRWIASTLLERTILLTGGTMLVAFVGALASHVLFDVPYPESRTAIYWIPL